MFGEWFFSSHGERWIINALSFWSQTCGSGRTARKIPHFCFQCARLQALLFRLTVALITFCLWVSMPILSAPMGLWCQENRHWCVWCQNGQLCVQSLCLYGKILHAVHYNRESKFPHLLEVVVAPSWVSGDRASPNNVKSSRWCQSTDSGHSNHASLCVHSHYHVSP
jgi:hypothetical protein